MIENLIVYFLVVGTIIFINYKALKRKNKEINRLEHQNTLLTGIIRKANILNKAPKDLDDE